MISFQEQQDAERGAGRRFRPRSSRAAAAQDRRAQHPLAGADARPSPRARRHGADAWRPAVATRRRADRRDGRHRASDGDAHGGGGESDPV